MSCAVSNWSLFSKKLTRNPHRAMNRFLVRMAVLDRSRLPADAALSPSGRVTRPEQDDRLAIGILALAEVNNAVADVFSAVRVHATYFGVMTVAGISDGKVHFFKPENERAMAADTLAKSHLLLIIMGIAVNNYFALGSDDVIQRLGKAYSDAWPVNPKEY